MKYLIYATWIAVASLTACTKYEGDDSSIVMVQSGEKQAKAEQSGSAFVLDIVSKAEIVYRFLKVEGVSENEREGNESAVISGYGVFDSNHNYLQDDGEKRVYFEFNSLTTSYILYENPYAE